MEKSKIYSQVYSILSELGEEYYSKLPEKMYNAIIDNKDNSYNPKYDLEKSLKKQQVTKDIIAIICYFHKNYWCKNAKEKAFIEKILSRNEDTKSPNDSSDIFGSRKKDGEDVKNDSTMLSNEKKSIIDRFLDIYLEK